MKADTVNIPEEAVAQLPEAVISFDQEGKVIYANAAAERIYPKLKDERGRLHFSDLFSYASDWDWVGLWEEAAQKRSFFRKLDSTANGSREQILWLNYVDSASPHLILFEIRTGKQELQDAVQSDEDTEKKLRQLNELNSRLSKEVHIRKKIEENLQAYAEELKSKNEELEQFAYVASHDLQEPLRMVSSFTQLLANRYSGKMDKDADEFIQYITDGARRMQDLISDLLIYSRVGRKGEEFGEVDLQEIVAAAEQNLSLQIEESDAAIHAEGLPSIYGDQRQLLQLMQNLLSNALKFKKENEQPVIAITAEENKDYWRISVKDNGIGIDPRHQERIFQIFQRLHTRDQYPGTGIGLAICKKIVERHGGEIGVNSNEGEGSIFYFTLKKHGLPMEM